MVGNRKVGNHKVGNRPPGGCVGDSRQDFVRSTALRRPEVGGYPLAATFWRLPFSGYLSAIIFLLRFR